MTDTTIKPGDVVQLKSGSLKLTVQDVMTVNGKPVASVVWADPDHAHHMATYQIAALKLA